MASANVELQSSKLIEREEQMKGILSKMLLLGGVEFLLIVRRKILWILVPGFLAGLLTIIVFPRNVVTTGTIGATQPPLGARVQDLHPMGFVLLSTLAGLLVGVGLALFSEARSGWALSETELTRLTGIPVLASIPIIQDRQSIPSKNREGY